MDDLYLEWFTSSIQKVNSVWTCLPLPGRVDTISTVSSQSHLHLRQSSLHSTFSRCTLRRSDCFYCIWDTRPNAGHSLLFRRNWLPQYLHFFLGAYFRIYPWSLVFSLLASMYRISLASTFAVGLSVLAGQSLHHWTSFLRFLGISIAVLWFR